MDGFKLLGLYHQYDRCYAIILIAIFASNLQQPLYDIDSWIALHSTTYFSGNPFPLAFLSK